jgi:multidrug resistance efflux pump
VVLNSTFDTWQTEVATLSDTNVDSITQSSIAHLTATVQYLENIITLLTSYTQVTSGGSQTTLATYQTSVTSARTTASTAITTLTTYSQAVRTAQANLDQAKASLALKQSPARPEDISIAEAQVQSAQSTVSNAQVNLANTVIRAPIDGTITQVDIKIGEQAQALKEVMKIQNVAQLHTEALVSEADIAYVEVGQTIDNTFDALGPDKHFTSTVLTVNPASTVISGVVNYKVTGSLENIPGVKPGMTANMVIRVAEKADALVIPSSAIVNKNNTKVVRVITDPKKKTYSEVTVTTGLEADGGLTEITSGLTEGQEVVTYMK